VYRSRPSPSYRVAGVGRLFALLLAPCVGCASADPGDVAPSDPRVASVEVTLASPSIAAGETTRASAVLREAGGAVVEGRAVGWSSDATTVATVDAAGVVTGVAAGSARVTATAGSRSGTAMLVVTAPAVETGAVIFADDFEQDRTASYFEVDDADGSFVRVPGVGLDGSWGMRARWTAGQVSAGSLKLAFGRTPDRYFRPVDAGTARYRELYWRLFVRNQPGWVGGGGHKLARAIVFATPGWAEAAIGHLWSGSTDQTRLVLDPASGTDAAGALRTTSYNDFPNLRWLGAGASRTPLFDAAHVGQWHCVEARMELDDAGASNGSFTLWIDGAREVELTGLDWLAGYDDYGINALFVENYWNDGSPAAQERYLDELVVSRAPIGCATTARRGAVRPR